MEKEPNEFTILDWIGFSFVIFWIIVLFCFPIKAARYEIIFSDFGSKLPAITALVVKPWFAISLGLISAGIFSLQLTGWVKSSLKRRRITVLASFWFASIALAICVIGLEMPFFKMVDAISS